MKTWIAVIPTTEVSKRELLFRLRSRSHGKRWQFGIEVGTNSGYKHYQCRYETSNGDYEKERRYWTGIKLELQEAGGWSEYELKDGTFYSYIDDYMGKYRWSKLKAVQLCILAKGRQQQDRKITIIVDKLGGIIGKTFLARRCSLNGTGIYIDGTDKRNINRNIYDITENWRPNKPLLLFIDLTRNDRMDTVLFRGIETLKNGYVSDGRFNYRYRWINPPQLFVFTNHEPEWEKLSKDRWDKIFITEENEKIRMWDRDKNGNPRIRLFNRNN